MAEDWAAVANAITARMQELGIKQRELAERANVSVATIRELQHNYTPRRRSTRTLQAIAIALEWPPGHLRVILNGGSAATTTPGTGVSPSDASTITTELAEMKSLLTQILDKLEKLPEEIGKQCGRS